MKPEEIRALAVTANVGALLWDSESCDVFAVEPGKPEQEWPFIAEAETPAMAAYIVALHNGAFEMLDKLEQMQAAFSAVEEG